MPHRSFSTECLPLPSMEPLQSSSEWEWICFPGWLRDPVAFKGFRKIPCWVWQGCMAGILEDIAVALLLDAAPERVRSEPRKGRSPRFFSILWPTNAPYGAHYERGEASRPIPKPLNATASRPWASLGILSGFLFVRPYGLLFRIPLCPSFLHPGQKADERASRQARRGNRLKPALRTGELANRRTGEPANWRTGEPANRRTGELANWRTGELANRRTGRLADWQTVPLHLRDPHGLIRQALGFGDRGGFGIHAQDRLGARGADVDPRMVE